MRRFLTFLSLFYSTLTFAQNLTSTQEQKIREVVPDISGIELVYVQGGTFNMGCTSEQGNDCDSDETVHRITVSPFYMGKYEVTQKEWEGVMGNNPSHFKNCNNCPVESVSWNDTQKFLIKLNEKTGKKYRLPTEAEWEFAARGGNKSRSYKYAGSHSVDEVAEYDKNNNSSTKPVGGKKLNELGLYDMSGNVWEWCQDWFGSYANSSQVNPTGSSSGTRRILRGGSWCYFERYCRVSYRRSYSPSDGYYDFGFRVILSP